LTKTDKKFTLTQQILLIAIHRLQFASQSLGGDEIILAAIKNQISLSP